MCFMIGQIIRSDQVYFVTPNETKGATTQIGVPLEIAWVASLRSQRRRRMMSMFMGRSRNKNNDRKN